MEGGVRNSKRVWTPNVVPGSPEAAALAEFLQELIEAGTDAVGIHAKAQAFHRKWGVYKQDLSGGWASAGVKK